MIIECDMARNDYYSCKGEKDSQQRVRQYIERNKVNPKIKAMAEQIILKPNKREDITIEMIEEWMKELKFRPLPHDLKVHFE